VQTRQRSRNFYTMGQPWRLHLLDSLTPDLVLHLPLSHISEPRDHVWHEAIPSVPVPF
jgi:hypothetical protein